MRRKYLALVLSICFLYIGCSVLKQESQVLTERESVVDKAETLGIKDYVAVLGSQSDNIFHGSYKFEEAKWDDEENDVFTYFHFDVKKNYMGDDSDNLKIIKHCGIRPDISLEEIKNMPNRRVMFMISSGVPKFRVGEEVMIFGKIFGNPTIKFINYFYVEDKKLIYKDKHLDLKVFSKIVKRCRKEKE